jgi:hypothetical protein
MIFNCGAPGHPDLWDMNLDAADKWRRDAWCGE